MGKQLLPLLEAVEVNHGPRMEIGRFILSIAKSARRYGITLHMCGGFDRLVEVNRMQGDTWSPLAPTFDPEVSDITQDNSGISSSASPLRSRIVSPRPTSSCSA